MALQHLLGMTLREIGEALAELNLPRFTAKQIVDWIYVKRVGSIDEMTNISVRNRDVLKKRFDVGRVEPVEVKTSVDGTQKMLFPVKNGKFIEAVTIPEENRLTLCVSSQVGCKMDCSFCMTGKMGFLGSLTANEILNQVYSVPHSEKITNLVFMGMGEPLNNYDNAMKAIEILTADYGLGWSPKRITLSTIGVIPKLKQFLSESKCHLAVSLHSPIPPQREMLMPIEKTFKAADIVDLLRGYDWSGQRRLSFEYIMFGRLNDSLAHARELSRLLSGLDCRINLIRFHRIPDSELAPSDEETMIRFRDFLSAKGFTCTVRASRGEDIFAACGMLSTSKAEARPDLLTREPLS